MKLTAYRLTALALAVSGAVSAETSVKATQPVSQTFNVIVAVQDSSGFTPSQLVESISSGESKAISTSAVGAISARLTFGDLGDINSLPPNSALRDMSRYVTLTYPTLMPEKSTLTGLEGNRAFGYVGVDSSGGFSARIPNDPLFSSQQWQWGSQGLAMPNAWEYSTGTRLLGLMDQMPDISFGVAPGVGQSGHEDLVNQFARNFAGNFTYVDETNSTPIVFTYPDTKVHGTHVAGLLSAKTDNATGVAGGCWDCRIAIASAETTEGRAQASTWLADSGVSIINLSGFISEGFNAQGYISNGTPCNNFQPPLRHPFCAVLTMLDQRDSILVASSGNDRRDLNFPARDPRVVAVGGTQQNGQIWDEGNSCVPNYTQFAGQECGSNFGPEQDFVAPAKLVFSTVGGEPYFNGLCGDPNNPTAKYGTCTGTSMSAPIITAALGILRSVNPLLNKGAVVSIMKQTASNSSFPNPQIGSGLPNTKLAVERVLGRSANKQVENRLTPAFALEIPASLIGTFTNKYINSFTPVTVTPDRLYTTQPNVALAAYGQGDNSNGGVYLSRPGRRQNTRIRYEFQAQGAQSIPQYTIPNNNLFFYSIAPKAAFALFTTRRNPFDNTTVANPAADEALMRPLYKMSFSAACDFRDHLYTTDRDYAISIEDDDLCSETYPFNDITPAYYPEPNSFRVDDIEGFILSYCPAGYTCNNPADPTEPQMLYQLSITGTSDRALVMEGDRSKPAYAAYVNAQAEALGYVFPYVDSDGDGLIDGFERILGTHPLAYDTDCDDISDKTEYPLAGVQAQNSDPAVGLAGCADRSVQVTGTVISENTLTRDVENIVSLKNNYGPTFGSAITLKVEWNNEGGDKISDTLPPNWGCVADGRWRQFCSGPTPAIGATIQLVIRTRRDVQNNVSVGTISVVTVNAVDPILTNNYAQWIAPVYVPPSTDASLTYSVNNVLNKTTFTANHAFTVTAPSRGSVVPAQLEISGLRYLPVAPSGWACTLTASDHVQCSTASMQPGTTANFLVSITHYYSEPQYFGSAALTGFTDPNLSNNQVSNIVF